MYIIGVTGGIGTGKSTATEYMRSKGYGYIDVDQIGRNLTAEGQPLLEIIGKEFGCVQRTGNLGNKLVLDRVALADIVFNDKKAKDRFDSIVHAEIIKIIDAKLEEYKEKYRLGLFDSNVILDAPLLFESGINEKCDVIIVITCDINKRITRVGKRDGLSSDKLQDRIRNQLDDEIKVNLADYVVNNSGTEEELYEQLDHILDTMKKPLKKRVDKHGVYL